MKKFCVMSEERFEERLLTNGRSGADVYRISLLSEVPQMTGHYIVKICEIADNQIKLESDKAVAFYNYAHEFTEHLVKVEAREIIDGKSIIVYAQANDSVIDTMAASQLEAEYAAKCMQSVSYDLLNSLNHIDTINNVSAHAQDFFQTLLCKQLGDTGRFTPRMEELLAKPKAESIVIDGVIYPNPLFFLNHLERISPCLSEVTFLKGAVHGDLHGDNVLASNHTYAVIDYDSSSTDSYLLFDHAYYEFSVFYDKSTDNDLKRWKAMLKKLIAPSVFDRVEQCENYMEYMIRNAVCDGIKRWVIDQNLQRQRDNIEIQLMMSRIAAGVNFFCKKTCNDTGRRLKVLLYVAYCLKLLLNKIQCKYDENDISSLQVLQESNNVEKIWESCVKYVGYIPVLVTEDQYSRADFDKLKGLCGLDWAMIIDIGSEEKEFMIYKFFLENYKRKNIKKINVMMDEKVDSFRSTLNVISLRKPAGGSYSSLWRSYVKSLMASLNKLLLENPLVPLMFIFDCKGDSLKFRDRFINALCDLELPGATRFIALQVGFSDSLNQEIVELETENKWRFAQLIGVDMFHVAQTCKMYLGESQYVEYCANLPSVEGVYTFTEEDLVSFAASVDLVYAGCEYSTGADSKDAINHGDSFGEKFYMGNEPTWDDIAQHRDLPLLEMNAYQDVLAKVVKWAEESIQRVKVLELRHGAGTGGTTLAKRILWDMKDTVPCAYLKKYILQTADILLEIYQRTGKKLFLAVEAGSTIITDEELNQLKQAINSKNGKLLILLIKRVNDNVTEYQNDTVLYTLHDNMPIPIAEKFWKTFSDYADTKPNAVDRKKWLRAITQNKWYKDQRAPFFYGFYTYQEEYRIFDTLERTINGCTVEERRLLNCLAIDTVFSQNICVIFREIPVLLNQQIEDNIINAYVIREMLSAAIYKLIVVRENGFRLCHEIIAKKILLLLFDNSENSDEEDADARWGAVIFPAINQYVEVMSEIYGNENVYLNELLRELLIDRDYIDSENRKTKFSPLVESIPRWTDRKRLFENLIEKFPNNPHYYSHLARLLAIGDRRNGILSKYNEAVELSRKAVEIALDAKNTHEVTLGCIYGWWINDDIQQEITNKKRGRLACGYMDLIESISIRYELAKSAFENARLYIGEGGYDSFNFFPQIKMECTIIKNFIDYDMDRGLDKLLSVAQKDKNSDEAAFREWYEEHFSVAMELYLQWCKYRKEDRKLQQDAKELIENIKENFNDTIKQRLDKLGESDAPQDRVYSRSLIYRFYAYTGFDWNKGKQEQLYAAEKCARKNLIRYDENHGGHDLEIWFELYRRVGYFKAEEAQEYIADYAEEGYRKDYLQFLMTFIMRKNGVTAASSESITRRIDAARRKAAQRGLNTLRELDVYRGNMSGSIGCPIISITDAFAYGKGELKGLETFTGMVTEVGQTSGKILLDKLNLDVTFIPNPTSLSKEDLSKKFTREDVGKNVEFNIMFAYSGLRGINVIRI